MRIIRGAAAFLLPCLLLAGCQMAENDPGGTSAAGTPQTEAPFFVGRWAAEENLCQGAAWEITAEKLSTPGHVICKFEQVRETATGYDIDATCTAEAPPAPYTLAVSYAQSAGALLIEGGPFEPVGLITCD